LWHKVIKAFPPPPPKKKKKKKHTGVYIRSHFSETVFGGGGGGSYAGFLFSILWCCQTGDHPQEDLDKFGYRSGMKVKKQVRICNIFGYML
jgi:hypothetical protein